ncbi:hypothetical protein KAH81_10405 [bacterium]|nr:hypothetical protein [bacterium]
MRVFGIVISFLILGFSITYAFRPAPPPGTPSFIVDEGIEVEYAYIDAVVLDTLAQVVFISSVNVPDFMDSIHILPNWPMDSVRIYSSMDIDSSECGILVLAGDVTVIDIKDKERSLIIRTSYEIPVSAALSGPPGEWKFGEKFGIYPPFRNKDGNIIEPKNLQIRAILPSKLKPIGSAKDFTFRNMAGDFVSWQLVGNTLDAMQIFQTK